MNGQRAILKSVLAAVGMVAAAGVAAAAAAPSQSLEQPPAAAHSSGQPPAATQAAAPAGADYVPGQVLVKYKAGVTAAGARADAASADAAVKDQITGPAVPGGRLVVVHSDTLTTPQLIAAYVADPQVEYAEPDYIVHVLGTPNDPRFDELWGMQQIYAPTAWNVSMGSSTVVVADIDTGVDYWHPDLGANIWQNPNEVGGTPGVDDDGNGYVDDYCGINLTANGNRPGNPNDDNGHGTHTAGTMAAVGNNGIGVTGVCQTAEIMACKFLDSTGHGTDSNAIKCINYIIWEKQHGVNVVAANNSWGSGTYNQSLHDAINAAANAGIVFVCAAGNDGKSNDTTPVYPATYDCANIISVANVESHNRLAFHSDWGYNSVDLAAPGCDVLSTVPTSSDPSGYAYMSGTSMAAPHVTGAIALCAAAFPSDTMAQRMNRVLTTTNAFSSLSSKVHTGGVLDVARAVGLPASSYADIPGVPMLSSHSFGSLDAAHPEVAFRVFLKAGAQMTARVSGGGANYRLYLFGSSATTVADKSIALASATAGAYPRGLTYAVPATGVYYVNLTWVSGSGNFHLAINSDKDEIPGVPFTPGSLIPWVDYTEQMDNVYSVPLAYGQTLTTSIVSPPAGADFCLYLQPPGAFTVWSRFAGALASVTSGAYPRTITHHNWTSGTYYVDVFANAGGGWYTLTHSVTGPGDNDISGAGSIPGSGYSGTISSTEDLDDVFGIQVPPAQTVNLSVAGDSGTEYDVYVFDSSATTVEGHQGAVVSATGTTYPQAVTFTSPPSPYPFSRTYYVDVHAVSGEGAYTLTYSRLNDTTAPVTTAAGLQTSPAAWQNAAQQVTLGPTDSGGSGLARTDYTLDGVQHVYSGPFTVSGSGSHTITYWSTDNAGNGEAHHTGYVSIDTTAPRTDARGLQEAPETGWTNERVDVTLTSTDDLSGVDATIFTVDGEKYVYRDPYTVSEPGSHEVTYWAVDAVGNEETPHHVGYVNIDTQPPDISPPTLSPEPNAAGWNNGDVAVTIHAKDGGGSGMQKTQYAVHGSEQWQDTRDHDQFIVPGPPDHRGDGEWVYDYRAFDNAGNRSDVGTVRVNIDTAAPSTGDDYDGLRRRYVSITLTAADATSGVATTMYRIDRGPWQPGTSVTLRRRIPHKVAGLTAGRHLVEYYSADVAGNVEIEIKSCIVEL
jgi:subtilisin family serine protease